MSNRKLEDTTIVQNDEITNQLKATREFFSCPEKWTKGASWCDKNGKIVGFWDDPDVHSACLGGALMIASRNIGGVYEWVGDQIMKKKGYPWISGWNDMRCRTFEQVIEMLDSLIEERIEEITHV